MNKVAEEIILTGFPICRGIAFGRLYALRTEEEGVPQFSLKESEIETEVRRYQRAIKKTKQEIRALQKQMKTEAIAEGALILEAHLQILRDPLLTDDIEKSIRALRKNAEFVFNQALESFRIRFKELSDPYFRERSRDIEDIGRRIMGHLMARHQGSLAEIPPHCVIFARDLTPSLVAEAIRSKVAALITETGGSTSHAAIVARAKGIPYISSVPYAAVKDSINALVVVDGRKGEIILRPLKATLEGYELIQSEIEAETSGLTKLVTFESETFDGYSVGLSANIDVESELEMLHQYGGNGVGLYRSEFVFLNYKQFPTEDEQYTTYKGIIDKLKGLPIVIRTFDIGGDKDLISQLLPKGGNPFLGCRAIRFLLREKDVFRAQIRAILRAGYKANVSIMFPMVSSLAELIEAKAVVKEAQKELKKEQIPFNTKIKIGCMIEVPSAAIISDMLAAECDFLSIGTNDLVQYSLAVDRSDESLSDFYTPAHPSIIRLIKLVVSAAYRFKVPVSVCGEVAADPRFVPLLLGLGVQQLSVAARFLPEIKQAIRKTSIVRAIQLAEEALHLGSSQEINALLDREYQALSVL
jgi:phosphotransferase system enzyme I (PtsI)